MPARCVVACRLIYDDNIVCCNSSWTERRSFLSVEIRYQFTVGNKYRSGNWTSDRRRTSDIIVVRHLSSTAHARVLTLKTTQKLKLLTKYQVRLEYIRVWSELARSLCNLSIINNRSTSSCKKAVKLRRSQHVRLGTQRYSSVPGIMLLPLAKRLRSNNNIANETVYALDTNIWNFLRCYGSRVGVQCIEQTNI